MNGSNTVTCVRDCGAANRRRSGQYYIFFRTFCRPGGTS